MAWLIAAALVLLAAPASAGPVVPIVASGLTSIGVSSALATALANIVVSLALSLLRNALFKPEMPDAPDLVRELQNPETLPPYRYVYGHTRVHGTPAPWRVKDDILYGCLILNSRPSEGNFTVYLDDREVTLSGDAYDFTGTGASATNAPFADHFKCWIGLGDQAGPPDDIVSEAPEFFDATDGWTGLTVLWVRMVAGSNDDRQERWPRTPPEVTVEGDWSLVWDPRDAAQSLDDDSTWTFSRNQALIALDALTQNPLRAYRESNLLIGTFKDAADVADETVAVKAGGTDPRYQADGVLIWRRAEIEDQIEPIMQAGAATFTRVGGRLGVVPGAYRAPSYTLTDVLGDSIAFEALKPGTDLPTIVRTSYTSAARDYETAELEPWDIPGAATADGGIPRVMDLQLPWVTNARQAMRLRKIAGLSARRQRKLVAVAPPDAFDLIAGATVAVDLPAPRSVLDGVYEVQSAHPGLSLAGEDGGVALRVPLEVLEHAAATYAWDAATEEEDVVVETFDATRPSVDTITGLAADTSSAWDINSGSQIIPRIRFDFTPLAPAAIDAYEVQLRVDDGEWQVQADIPADRRDGDGDVYGFVLVASPTAAHDIRVRSRINGAPFGSQTAPQRGAWATIEDVIPALAVTVNSGAGGAGEVSFGLDTPDYSAFDGVKIYRSATDDFSAATDVSGLIPLDHDSAAVTATATGLAAGTDFYWIVPVTETGTEGAAQGSYELTVT